MTDFKHFSGIYIGSKQMCVVVATIQESDDIYW